MLESWDDMNFWSSPDWQRVQERLDGLDTQGIRYNPRRELLFAALDGIPFSETRVAIIGQDPYPTAEYATGFCFSIPDSNFQFPPTLHNIFMEYQRDLGLDYPSSGDLIKWVDQGVLLWNAVPSCTRGKSLSHNWKEWRSLTQEIVTNLNEKGCVFVFLGSIAREFAQYVDTDRWNFVIETSHPSPRASARAKNPFIGCRMFSTINSKLQDPIDWRLE